MPLTDKLKQGWGAPPSQKPVAPAETPTPAAPAPPAAPPPQTAAPAPAAPPASAPAPAGRLNPLGGMLHPLMQIMSAIKSSPDPSLQDAAQEGKDIARSGANYFTGNAADNAFAQIGQREPPGTPSWLQFNPDAQAQRTETAAARERLGAFDKYGVAPVGIGALMGLTGGGGASLIPRMGAYRGGSAYQGGERDPLNLAWETGKGFVEGAVPSVVNKVLVGPLASYFGKRAYGSDTPESIAAQTKAGAQSATEEATATTRAAQTQAQAAADAAQTQAQAAKEALANVPVSRKDLGFSFTKGPLSDTPNPKYSDLQAELDNIAKMTEKDDPGGVGPFLSQRINRAMSQSPGAQEASSASDLAAQRAAQAAAAEQAAASRAASVGSDPAVVAAQGQATTADQLARWNWQSKVRGMDVPGQALDYLKANPDLPLTQRDAYAAIANAGVQGGSNLRDLMGSTIGAVAGRGVKAAAGAFGLPAPGASEVGTYLGGKIFGGGGDATAATQQALLNSYKALLPNNMPGALQTQLASDQAKQAVSRLFLGAPGTGLY